MRLGIFAKTFARSTLAETLNAVLSHGIYVVQFNLACAGLPTLPDRFKAAEVEEIRTTIDAHHVTMAAVSGTFNMINPDLSQRHDGLRRLGELISVCQRLGTSVITLCTGTRDPADMWCRHPANDSPEAWQDLVTAMGEALEIAQDTGVTLAFEPEVANVVDSARKARSLLDEMRSSHLKVVMDPANLFHAGELPRMPALLDEAFDLLAQDIVIAHAKDLSHDGEAGRKAAGEGRLDYDQYLRLLHETGFAGPVILHGLHEARVARSIAFLREKFRSIGIGDAL